MKKLLRSLLLGGLMCLLAAMLGGCGLFKPVESLFALPDLPDEYSQLQAGIQSVMDQLQAEYAVIYGSNASTIQLLDMDSDGLQETAAVFLRVNAEGEKPLQVCLFRRDTEGAYRLAYTVKGDGMYFHSVAYEDLTGDGVRELIVSWQMSARVNTLSAYQLSPSGANELMSTGYNERYLVTDLDGDYCKEIVVLQQHSSDADNNRAEYYRYRDGTMIMASVAPLSASVQDVLSVQTGVLSDGVSGIYVNSQVEGGVLTDILVLKEDGLSNVTLDTQVGISQRTLRVYTEVNAVDINGDKVLEIPVPVKVADPDATPDSNHYLIYWRQFDSRGGDVFIPTATYHSVTDGWYLLLPNSWLGKITVARDDSGSLRGERAVVFYYWPDNETTTPAPFLTIYRLTGDNRFSRAKLSGRVILVSDSSAIYCATLNPDVWECGVEASDLSGQFRLIKPEWSMQ